MDAVARVADATPVAPRPVPRVSRGEIALALAAFAVLCVVVLITAPMLVEPDDYAYRASILAVTDGHFFTLSSAQVHSLSAQLNQLGGPATAVRYGVGPLGGSIEQWVRLPGGRWISEKDPGYPYLAAPFQWLGIIRLAPLFFGALACAGLFFGGRRWLGRYGGTVAAGLYCTSGAALLFGWRDYMPTFTDASLIAAGAGALLWVLLSDDAPARRRTWIGLAAFVAIELAVFTRYTNLVALVCAVAVVLVLRWRRPASLPPPALWWWLGSVVLFCTGTAVFDDLIYGGPLKSGYRPGEIRFSLGSVLANLRYMPAHLMQAMPVLVLGLIAVVWIGTVWIGTVWIGTALLGGRGKPESARSRRDAAVGLALAACWLGLWGLYAAYNWTAYPGLSTLQAARFYLEGLGAICLLAAWLLTRLPDRAWAWLPALTSAALIAVSAVAGVVAFDHMRTFEIGPLPHIVHGAPGGHGPGGPAGPGHSAGSGPAAG